MAFIDGVVVNIALPAIQSEFNAPFNILQWVINAYALLLGALILTGGALGDRFGRRFIFVIGIALFAVSSIACASASSAAWLIGARAMQGLGGALLVPQSLAIIAATFPKEARGRAIGIWAAAAALTTASGPIVGGIFIDVLSWRAVFWINVPLAILAIALAFRFIPESRGTTRGPTDWIGSIVVTLGLALIIYAMTELPKRGSNYWLLSALVIAGVLTLVGFVRRESTLIAPLMPLSVFRSRVFSATNAITLCLYFALSAALFLLPYTLIQVRGYTAFWAGASLIPFGLVMGLFSSYASALSDRFGLRAVLSTGSGLVALACIGFALIEGKDHTSYWMSYFPPILLLAVGMTINVAPLTTAVINSVSDDLSGAASGINNAVSRIAGVVAVALVGLVTLFTFSHYLAGALAAAGIDAPIRNALLADSEKLAALRAPAGVTGKMSELLHGLIANAFIDSYRAGMLVAAVVAVVACLLAVLYLPGRGACDSPPAPHNDLP
jgi:EmrB/QacA subfamily drug resistance transporter